MLSAICRLKTWMLRKGLNQYEVAEKFGISQSLVNLIISDKRSVSDHLKHTIRNVTCNFIRFEHWGREANETELVNLEKILTKKGV